MLLLQLLARPVWACASCGSGGGDPMVLYPHERLKAYIGASRSQGRQALTAAGDGGRAVGAGAQEALVLSVGAAWRPRAFMTLTSTLLRNSAAGAAYVGLADPSLAARLSVVLGDKSRPWLPQVQLIGGMRPGWARACTTGTVRRADQLDRMGDGAWELRGGVDAWWEQRRLLAGVATFALWPQPLQLMGAGTTVAGATWRTVATIGWDFAGTCRWLLTGVFDRQADRRWNGKAEANSGRRAINLATTFELPLGGGHTLRLSAARAGLPYSRLALRDVSFGMALMRAW